MIGMILLAVLAVMIFFGFTANYFAKMGVANWVAFLVVLAFAVAAVFPSLVVGSVSFSYAGFFLPLLLGIVLLFSLGFNSNMVRAIVGMLAVAGIVVAARIAIPPATYTLAIASICIIGFVGGIVAFIVGQTRTTTLAATLCGIVLGDFITAMLFRFVSHNMGYYLMLGQNGIFDSVVLATLIGAVTLLVAGQIGKVVSRRAMAVPVAITEAAEDPNVQEHNVTIPPDEEDDLFDDYFNDDID